MTTDETPTFKPLCVFCSAPWSDANVEVERTGSWGSESAGEWTDVAVSITCHKCGKEMYRKEGWSV